MPYVTPSPSSSVASSPGRERFLPLTGAKVQAPPPQGSWGPAASPSWGSGSLPPMEAAFARRGSEETMSNYDFAASPPQRRHLRNHLRSQSHDAVPTLSMFNTSKPSAATPSSIRIYPASPGDGPIDLTGEAIANGEAIGLPAAFADPGVTRDDDSGSTEGSDEPSEALQLASGPTARRHRRKRMPRDTSPQSPSVGLPDMTSWPEGDPQPSWPAPLRRMSADRAASTVSTVVPTAPLPSPAIHTSKLGAGSDLPPGARGAAPMIRKKSGELVRSSLKSSRSDFSSLTVAPPPPGISPTGTREVRAKSVPSTPTGPKYVHFDSQLEHVKLFLAQQRPTAVSRTGSPEETETETEPEGAFPFPAMLTSLPPSIALVAPDIPAPSSSSHHRDDGRHVALDSLVIAPDRKSLRGTVVVRNIAFEKRVALRFTADDWQTVSEVAAEYLEPCSGNSGFDRWQFFIKLQDLLARIENITLLLAARYSVDGREHWDNNRERNYRIQFRRERPASRASSDPGSSSSAPSRSTATPLTHSFTDHLKRELTRLADDDFGGRLPLRNEPADASASRSSSLASRYDMDASLKNRGTGMRAAPPLAANPYFHPASGAESPSGSYTSLPTVPNSAIAHPAHSLVPSAFVRLNPPAAPMYSGLPSSSWGQMEAAASNFGAPPAPTASASSPQTPLYMRRDAPLAAASSTASTLALNDAQLNSPTLTNSTSDEVPPTPTTEDGGSPEAGDSASTDSTPPPSSPVKIREVRPVRGSPPPRSVKGTSGSSLSGLVSPSPASSVQSSPRSSATASPPSEPLSAEMSGVTWSTRPASHMDDYPSYEAFVRQFCYAGAPGSALGLVGADDPSHFFGHGNIQTSSLGSYSPGASTPVANSAAVTPTSSHAGFRLHTGADASPQSHSPIPGSPAPRANHRGAALAV